MGASVLVCDFGSCREASAVQGEVDERLAEVSGLVRGVSLKAEIRQRKPLTCREHAWVFINYEVIEKVEVSPWEI